MAFLSRKVSGTTVGIMAGMFVLGLACGFGLATWRARHIVEMGRENRRVLIVKMSDDFYGRALVKGDANAVRCLDALARQTLLPDLAAGARRDMRALRATWFDPGASSRHRPTLAPPG
ncbi:MAG: hypothetical protein ACYTKD_10435 [Planctomycetota bacterium]|jgi:hypothetical protein